MSDTYTRPAIIGTAQCVNARQAARAFHGGRHIIVSERQTDDIPVSTTTTIHSAKTTTWDQLTRDVDTWRNRYPEQRFFVVTYHDPNPVCRICRNPVMPGQDTGQPEIGPLAWVHVHSLDVYCGTGDGAVAEPADPTMWKDGAPDTRPAGTEVYTVTVEAGRDGYSATVAGRDGNLLPDGTAGTGPTIVDALHELLTAWTGDLVQWNLEHEHEIPAVCPHGRAAAERTVTPCTPELAGCVISGSETRLRYACHGCQWTGDRAHDAIVHGGVGHVTYLRDEVTR